MKSSEDAREKPPRPERLEGIVIRAARPADADAIAALANMPGYRYGTLRLPFQTVEETRKGLETPNPGAKRLIAELEGRIIGDTFLGPLVGRRRHAATLGMGVHDDFTGRGVGSALMTAVLDIADNWLNLRRVELTVFTDNDNAIRLYEKSGFVKEGHLKEFAFRDGAYVDAYSMARLRT
ncbi:GNAT family N-acetyltransferase [Neorhizobium sp. DT-125]|uniref:GNAT family N-acetyltransferase n=1 Tax=Neorhizobium sp. DT-125 TaxID=3396163 RepID=UPI003F1AF3C5